MLNLLAMALTVVGNGLLGAGSACCVPAFIATFAGWGLADRFSFDVEFLGGLMIQLMGAGG